MPEQTQNNEMESLVASGRLVMEDPDEIPDYSELESSKEEPEQEQEEKEEPAIDHQEAEEAEDYKAKYEELKALYDDLAQFGGIIGRLRTDDELIDVLEAHMEGRQYAGPEQLWDAEDEPGSTPEGNALTPEQQAEEIKRAEQRGAAKAAVQKQVQDFATGLAKNGATEEEINSFLSFVDNPSGVTLQHLYNVHQEILTGAKGEAGAAGEKKPGQKKPRGSISTMPGETDKPAGDRYLSDSELHKGTKYVADPNNL